MYPCYILSEVARMTVYSEWKLIGSMYIVDARREKDTNAHE